MVLSGVEKTFRKIAGWEKCFLFKLLGWVCFLLLGSGGFFRHACFQPSVALGLLDIREGSALDEPMRRLLLGVLVGARQCSPWTFVFRRARPVH